MKRLVAILVFARVLVPALFLLLVPLTTTWAAGGLSVTTPNGGQKWTIGKKYAIKWRKGTAGTSVRISLTKSGRHYRWISGKTRNDGRYTWKIPASVAAGSAYKIKIKSVKKKRVLDSSNRYFTIKKKTGRGVKGNPYAGQYDGSVNVTVRAFGLTVSDSFPYRVVVGVDGDLSDSLPGISTTGECSGGPASARLKGRRYSATGTFSCYFPEFGHCRVPAKGSIVFSASGASMRMTATYYCDVGTLKAWFSSYLRRTTRLSSSSRTSKQFRASSKRGQGLLFSPGLFTKLVPK